MKLLNINAFERIASQRIVTIAEVVNTLYGLNPNTKLKDLPEEIIEETQEIRKAISRNIRSLGIRVHTVNDEMDSDLVFAAAHDFMRKGVTPSNIIERGEEAVIAYIYMNDWENYMFAFGGRSLVDLMTKARKSGRGKHRKVDEEIGTMKMMGALLKLLAEKHPTGKYGSKEKPTISEIYNDIKSLLNDEELTMKGLGRSTFASKASAALKSFYDES